LRKILIAALAALTALAVVSIATAQEEQEGPGATAEFTLSPKKAGTKKKPKAVKLNLKLENEDSSQTADSIKVFTGKNIKSSTKGLKKCKAATLEAEGKGACPAASKIGTGSADAIAGVNTGAPAKLKFNITAFVIGNQQIGFYLEQQGGDIKVLSKGRFKKASGQYGGVLDILDISIPQLAREFPQGTFNGLVGIETSLYKKKGKNALFKLNGCPSNRTVPFKLEIGFMPNPNPPKAETVTALAGADCRKN
jgi:hypothetical protein